MLMNASLVQFWQGKLNYSQIESRPNTLHIQKQPVKIPISLKMTITVIDTRP